MHDWKLMPWNIMDGWCLWSTHADHNKYIKAYWRLYMYVLLYFMHWAFRDLESWTEIHEMSCTSSDGSRLAIYIIIMCVLESVCAQFQPVKFYLVISLYCLAVYLAIHSNTLVLDISKNHCNRCQWNDERFAFLTTLVDNNLSDVSKRCSSPNEAKAWGTLIYSYVEAIRCVSLLINLYWDAHYPFNLRCGRVGVACMGSTPKLPVRGDPAVRHVIATIAIEVWTLQCRPYADCFL